MDKVIKKKIITTKRVIIFIIIAILTTVFINKIVMQEFAPTFKVKLSEIILAEVTEKEISKTIQTIGLVEPVNRVSIETSESGKVINIIKKSGAKVKSGDVIIILENENIQNELIQLKEVQLEQKQQLILCIDTYRSNDIDYRENLLDLEYKIDNLNTTLITNKMLFKSKSIAKAKLDTSEKEYNYYIKKRELFLEKLEREKKLQESKENLISLELNSIEKKIKFIETRVERLTIRSSYSGILQLEDFTIGENIHSQQKIAQIERQNDFILTANIDEFYIQDINIGDRAVFNLKGNKNYEYEAEVRFISPNIEKNKVKLEFDFISELPESVITGQSIKIKILQENPKLTKVVESGSFMKASGGKWVYKLENKEAIKVPIEVGTKNRDELEIISGLDPGDKIIISNYNKYKNYETLIIEEK